MRVGDVAELTIDAEAAFGEDGSDEYNVPPGTSIRIMVHLTGVVHVDDLSGGSDRSALRKVLQRGTGLSSPIKRYDCTVDFDAYVIPTPPSSLPEDPAVTLKQFEALTPNVTRKSAVVTIGDALPEGDELKSLCNGLDVETALQVLCLRCMWMKCRSSSRLIVPHLPLLQLLSVVRRLMSPTLYRRHHRHRCYLTGGGDALRLVITLHSWVRVDEVSGTGTKEDIVLKRNLYDAPVDMSGTTHREIMAGGVPPPESMCRIRYLACVKRADKRAAIENGGDQLGEVIEGKGDRPELYRPRCNGRSNPRVQAGRA